MNNNQYTYNQPPMGPMMPQMGAPRPRGWRERWMRRFGMDSSMPMNRALTIPQWLTGKSIIFFFISMLTCWMAFGYMPVFDLWIVAAISVVLFFYGGQALAKGWERKSSKTFVSNILVVGFVLRLLWVLYCYFYFNPEYRGNTYGETADVEWYMPYGKAIAQWISNGFNEPFGNIMKSWGGAVDDVGYPFWLGIVYWIVGVENDVFVPFLLKCLASAYCAVCVYHIAKRHFGEGTARIAAVFVCVNPNMIYWCGNMFKEAEMVFLACLSVDLMDKAITSKQRLTFKSLLPGILVGFSLFFFRSALGLIIFLAMFAHIIMASGRVMSLGKKIIAGILVTITLIIGVGDSIRSQTEYMIEAAQSDAQQENMEWRSRRQDGSNSFAKYASAAVFAPLIFTIPFPTFNAAQESQLLQMQLAGGSYVKNVLSFFVIMVLLMMLISSEWRRHVFIIAYTVGYLAVLAMSSFAQSGRFHMPIWPMFLLFAAYGIQIAKTNIKLRQWYNIVLILEVVASLAWNWFKLKGRGMI